MNTKIKLLVFTTLMLAIFSSCFDGIIIEGNNEIAEETRSIPNFTEVTSSGSFNIYYSHGVETSVRIECESNLIPYIETAVFDNSLDIRFALHVNVHHSKDIDIYVTSPAISKIELSGSGKIEADSVSANSLELDVSGSGNINTNFYGNNFKSEISGSGVMNIFADCDKVETSVSGSGRINLTTLNCLETIVNISGSGRADMEGSANAATFIIVGSGKVNAYNYPVKNAEITISGSGNVFVYVSETLDALLSGSGNLHYKGHPDINYNVSGSGNLVNDN